MIVNNLNFNAAWKSALLNIFFFYVFEGTIVLWIYSMPTFLSLSTRVPAGTLYYRQSTWYKYKYKVRRERSEST